jgi:surface polysaccharide O-acyltransferase-like enzyme
MRRQRIDAFRIYALFLIVCAHVQFFGGVDHGTAFGRAVFPFVTVVVRYTMPFFFILAGYFTGGRIAAAPADALPLARAYTWRILAVLGFWCVVYAVERPQEFLRFLHDQPIAFLFEGSRIHLWFLVSLLLTVWLFALWPDRRDRRSFLALGAALYVLGLLGGSYRVTPAGLDLHFQTRNGIFFSTLFFGIGVVLHDRGLPRVRRATAAAIAAGGLALYCAEALYLRRGWGSGIPDHDYLLGTVPFGIGMALLALTQEDSPLDARVGPYGRYTLGIYAIHLLFLDLFKPLGARVGADAWQVLYPLLVFGCSLLASAALARTPLRKVVT